MKIVKYLYIFISVIILSSCAATNLKSEAYKDLYNEKAVSVLIMPPINKSTHVEAKEYFYSTLNHEIAEDGYYVFPQFLMMDVLKKESAYDSELFVDRDDLSIFKESFGADLILFTTIHDWKKNHIGGKINVDIEYTIKSSKNSNILYHRRGDISVNTSINVSGGGLAGALISIAATAINTSKTKYVNVARATNLYTLESLPKGKYHYNYLKDGSEQVTVKDNQSKTIPLDYKRKQNSF
ncbi:hypothetical protein FHR24_000390 [Wenyingzhuangia heitensis]|uniref:Lipoprotein n=1 Tax=Wenyingzhuangia heitensis TaxID=1487859 RepID=A0ABX0U9X4_9FLAO|nr:GNA1162 family protein [Wenyingzhuangia heitensis]NIJ43951.1 hypothetical protein [Wenyingzhuangia heitensis]